MKAEILCVGTELLLGDVVNTNAAFAARELAAAGILVYHQTVVGDNDSRLRACLDEGFARSDVIILTGGLGPTYDDMTKETVADWFGKKLVLHQPSLDHIEAFFKSIGTVMTPNNIKQAMMPEGCTIFPNDCGTAPGLAITDGMHTAVMLPGPPREMEPMFARQVMPYLAGQSGQVLRSRTLHVYGLGESRVEDMLRAEMESSTNPTIAPYAKEGEMQLRITALAPTEEEAYALTDPVTEQIRERLGSAVYGVDCGSLEECLVEVLKEKKLTVSAAESCTGGLIAKRITDIPGSSAVFGYGAVTYWEESKQRMVGVKPETLAAHGVVSEEVAREMAEGIRAYSGSDIGIGITGLAGPDGGTEEKPVGLVWLALSSEKGTETYELHLKRGYRTDRALIRRDAASRAIYRALMMARSF